MFRVAADYRYGHTDRSRSLPSTSTMMRERERERGIRPSVCPSVCPTRILTHVGSVLRQRGGGFSLSFASSPSPPPCPPPSRRAIPLSANELPANLPPPPLNPLARSPVHRSYATSVVTPPALPPSSASSSCRYRYHYHCPRHYHRRGGVDDASSSAFSWPSPPAKSTWWLPHHLGDPAPLSTNDQRLSLLRGANRAHGGSRDLSPLRSWVLCPTCLSVSRLRSLIGGGRYRRPFDFESHARQ